jgi:DNA repair exonuclease SbcCD nuclease subunit
MAKVALIADSQLGKRLYGLQETYLDWLKAFRLAGSIVSKNNEVKGVIFLGDTFDAEAMYPPEIQTASEVVAQLKNSGKEVWGILGNHDKGQSDIKEITSWLDVSGIKALPPGGTRLAGATWIGIHHQNRNLLRQTLENLTQPTLEGPYILCLHQALKELCGASSGWEVQCSQIPSWVDRVFLGDLHNHCLFHDERGREFMYPGAIETVSFNQETEPGFILFDVDTGTIEHISTKQRDYIKVYVDNLDENWQNELSEQIKQSTDTYQNKPVLQLISREPVAEAIKSFVEPLCLKFVTVEFGLYSHPENSELVPDSNIEIRQLAAEFLPNTPLGALGRNLLDKPQADTLLDWQKANYPNIPRTC